MSEKKMVIVDDKLISKIDGQRGPKTRSEYVDSCMRNIFQQLDPDRQEPVMSEKLSADGDAPVSRQEFDQFKSRMDRLNQEFMDFFVRYAGFLASEKPSRQDAEEFARELRRLLSR